MTGYIVHVTYHDEDAYPPVEVHYGDPILALRVADTSIPSGYRPQDLEQHGQDPYLFRSEDRIKRLTHHGVLTMECPPPYRRTITVRVIE